MRKYDIIKSIKEYLIVTIGVVLVAFGLQYFYAPNDIAGGGLSGLSLVINHYIPFLSVGTLVFLGNLILFVISFILVGGDFGLKTIYASFALSFVMDFMEKVMHSYALTTNLVGDINEIFKIVKGRWEIEESFRIMKSDFLARPINLSREDRIKAHFMTCFISLFIYRLLEKKLNYKYTTSQILDTLRNMNVLETKGDGYIPEYIRTDLTDDLHELFGFRTDYEINTYKDLKKIFEQIK